MEQPETNETAPIESVEAREASPAVAPARPVAGPVITQGTPGCPTCGGVAGAQNGGTASSSYVYALGQIETRFPRPSVEKEVAQATGRAETAGHTDQQAFHHVLSRRENRYLVRQLCWILSIQGLETYILQPRDPADIDLLIGVLNNTEPLPWISTVIGVRGPIAPPEFCNGLMIPIVAFDQIPAYTLIYRGSVDLRDPQPVLRNRVLRRARRPAIACPLAVRHAFLFRENPGERDERSQNHDRLKADRANDPLQNIGLYLGNISFEFGL